MLRYDIRTGVKKIKTKTFMAISGATLASAGLLMAVAMPFAAKAATPAFQLNPFEFVGTVENCGSAGTDTVTAKWDSTTGNPSPSILLQKLGPTENCAAAGVDIVSSLESQPVSGVTELNFDYQNGGWCGAGAPRFNLQLSADGSQNAFLGCSAGTHTDLGNGWTHVEFSSTDIQNAVTTAGGSPTSTLYDLYIIFDEGQTQGGNPLGSGTVNIDNVSVNNLVVGSPTSPVSQSDCKNGNWQNMLTTNGDSFKNQGQCVSYAQHTNGTGQDDVHAKAVKI